MVDLQIELHGYRDPLLSVACTPALDLSSFLVMETPALDSELACSFKRQSENEICLFYVASKGGIFQGHFRFRLKSSKILYSSSVQVYL